ncbi:MAG: hypothetical protein ACXWUS_17000 [Burkholderiales bacterium]
MNDFASGAVLDNAGAGVELDGMCRLELTIDDPMIVPELRAYAEGPEGGKSGSRCAGEAA